ncbi:MAG: regulatory signaling modulator protein AmpE [Gammaproteobacteria bacterium]
MSLIAILLSLFVESFWHGVERWRRHRWFESYVAALLPRLEKWQVPEGPLLVLAVVVPLVFGVWLVTAMLGGLWSGFAYVFSVAVLIFCLGPQDLNRQVQQYLEAVEREDEAEAKRLACEILGYDCDEDDGPMQAAENLREAILTQIVDRVLGVFFWFVILGPVGAALFRSAHLLQQYTAEGTSTFARTALQLYQIVFWLPARLCVLAYALAGNFVDSMSYWNSPADLWQRESRDLLVVSGVGSLRQDMRYTAEKWLEEQDLSIGVSHALALVKRTVIVWLVVLALLTLSGWLF